MRGKAAIPKSAKPDGFFFIARHYCTWS